MLHAGSDHRNHCPNCLSSLHVDEEPGDRASDCGGIMEPVAVWVRKGGEWAIIHRCKRCGKLSSNRVAADDNTFILFSFSIFRKKRFKGFITITKSFFRIINHFLSTFCRLIIFISRFC